MFRAIELKTCRIEGCTRPARARRRVCLMHQVRQDRHGDYGGPGATLPKPDHLIRGRYRLVAQDGKTCYAHRVVWGVANGPIPPGHVVHHADGNRLNNSLDNLVLMSEVEHARIHGRGHRGSPYRG